MIKLNSGTRRAFVACILVSGATSVAAAEWTPPIAIPIPEFGIEETHRMYAGQEGYRDAGNGPYTLYVDNRSADCSDDGPGTESEPLCQIPRSLPDPGTVVEIHGGPYGTNRDALRMRVSGERDRPVFIRGVDDGEGFPVIKDANVFFAAGQYFIVENLRFIGTAVGTGAPRTPASEHHHIAIRNNEIARHPRKNGSGLRGTDVVFYGNHVHHNQGDDRHGTIVAPGAERVWIVDNYYHHNGGDAVQLCHGCRKEPPKHVYIGRNHMHSDRENGVDLKFGEDIVISQNTIYGYRASRPGENWCYDDESYCGKFSSGSDGSAIVIGSDGAPERPWVIANHIYDSHQGVRIEEVDEAWIIGNYIHDIKANAIGLEKWGQSLHLTGNVMSGAEFGINQYWRDKFGLIVKNNVFAYMRDEFIYIKSKVATRSVAENNIFWNNDKTVRLIWGHSYKARPKSGTVEFEIANAPNFVANPGLTDADGTLVSLGETMPAYNAFLTQLAEHDQAFKEVYGSEVSIIDVTKKSDFPVTHMSGGGR